MAIELNCTHPLASAAGNVSKSVLYSLLLEEESNEFLLKIPAFVFIIIYVCLGIPGNVFVIVVYSLRFRSSTTKVFVIGLSTFDLISCVIGLPFEMVDMRYDLELDLPVLCKTLRFVITFCACGSTLILLSVATDRFRRICKPFTRQMSVRQSKFTLLIVTIVSLCISFPALLLYGRKTKVYKEIALVDCTIDDQWADSSFAIGYQFNLGLLWIFSILALCVMYGIIISKIRQQEIRRLNLTSNSLASVNFSKFNAVTSNESRNNNVNGIASDKGIKIISVSNPVGSRSHSKSLNEQSENNLMEGKMHSGGQENPLRPPNPLNRLFSRDVNPIYEEEDDAQKPSNSRLDDVIENNEDDAKECESSVTNTVGAFSNDVDSSRESNEKRDEVIQILVNSDYRRENNEPGANCTDDSVVQKTYDAISRFRSSSCPLLNVDTRYQESDATKYSADNMLVNTNYTTSGSIPSSLESSRARLSLSDDCQNNAGTPDDVSHMTGLYRKQISCDPSANDNDESTPKCQERNSSGLPDQVTHRLEVAGKRYPSDDRSIDRLTSMSDRTNGSVLTLRDSRLVQDRHGTMSGRSSASASINRQISVNSSNGSSSQNARRKVSKSNSITSHSSGGRKHKNSVNFTRRQSTAPRELKASRIAVMMCYVTMGHVLSYLPHLAIQFHRALGPGSLALLMCNSVYFAFHHLLLRSIYLNNAINPIIYSYNNGQFRQYCAQLLTKPLAFCRRRRSNYTVDSAHSLTMD